MINGTSLKKRFITDKGQVVDALNDVSFTVASGEFYVLLGPSGSGKTTTLRSVAGIETVDSGEIQIDTQTVFSSSAGLNIPPEERPVAMMFQSYALWPHMDVYNNIVFPLRKGVRRVAAPEIERRVKAITETLQLEPYLRRPISQLSGGQQQRVALARALALEPAVLLMDEPLSNLDAKLRIQLRIEIKKITRTLGITTLYVTHDQVEAMVMGDRIAVMDGGQIIEEGTPEQLYKRPSSEFVGRFLGEMNFIPGSLQQMASGEQVNSGDTLSAQTPFGTIPIDAADAAGLGKTIKLGFRPEDVQVGARPDGVSFKSKVTQSYYIGDALLCDMMVGDHGFTARLPNTFHFKEGDETEVSLKHSDFNVFPNSET